MKEKILLDTDIGSDIDDAVCLAYLLANPDCDLMGITTVSGESYKRAMIANVICRAAGKDIPVYPGAEDPLIIGQKQKSAPQAEILDKFSCKKDFTEGEAIEFLRQTIRNNPHQITLLTIGPLTNIGLLFKTDPVIPSLLKKLVMMCGVFTFVDGENKTEWNASLDPHSTAIVYSKKINVHSSVGLDVTKKVFMPAEEIRASFKNNALLKTVLPFAEVFFRQNNRITFHDILAASVIFKPEICTFKKGRVDVELKDDNLMGMTRFTPAEEGFCNIAVDVNPDLFFQHFFSFFV
jgi:purine nucleosidase